MAHFFISTQTKKLQQFNFSEILEFYIVKQHFSPFHSTKLNCVWIATLTKSIVETFRVINSMGDEKKLYEPAGKMVSLNAMKCINSHCFINQSILERRKSVQQAIFFVLPDLVSFKMLSISFANHFSPLFQLLFFHQSRMLFSRTQFRKFYYFVSFINRFKSIKNNIQITMDLKAIELPLITWMLVRMIQSHERYSRLAQASLNNPINTYLWPISI